MLMWLRRRIRTQKTGANVQGSQTRETRTGNADPNGDGSTTVQAENVERVRSLVAVRHFKEIVYGAIALGVLVFIVESIIFLPKLSRVLDGAAATLNGAAKTTQATAQQVEMLKTQLTGMIVVLQTAVGVLQHTSKRMDTTFDHLDAVLLNLQTLEAELNKNVNGKMLPEMTATIEQTKLSIKTLQEDEKKFGNTIDSGNQTLAIFNEKTLPAVNAELASIKGTTDQVTSNLQTMQTTQKRIDNVAAHYEKILTTPKTMAHKVAGWFISFGEHVAAFWTANQL